MLSSSPLVAFVPSTDLVRSRTFYEDLLGLTVSEVNPYALVLVGRGATIRVAKVAELVPQPFTVLGWIVTDMKKAVEALTARSVEFIRYTGMDQDADGIWTAPGGDRVAWFKDPDRNTLSLTQLA
jgi:catechol 2,3-dioxygenase-like lactoylglutathione lyase family enzyme